MKGCFVRSALLLRQALDFMIPPLCLVCRGPVGEHNALCPSCWKEAHFISSPYCAVCGEPFEVPVDENTVCNECMMNPPVFRRARSAMIYDDISKSLLLGFKHGDKLHLLSALASWMQKAGREIIGTAGFIVPVPLHRWRLLRRRYNQAALLANALGRSSGKEVIADMLLRSRNTPVQGNMSREERRKNVAGAFTINPRHADKAKGKTFVIVDDVLTTGATVNECGRVLLKAGAAAVDVLTLARTRSFAKD